MRHIFDIFHYLCEKNNKLAQKETSPKWQRQKQYHCFRQTIPTRQRKQIHQQKSK